MKVQSASSATAQLASALQEARARLLELVEDLDDKQMLGPRLDIVNPLRWEIAHVAHFQEYWLLRHLRGFPATWPAADRMYDSARVAHDTRWALPLPTKRETIKYMQRILYRVLEETDKSLGQTLHDAHGYDEAYFLELALLHEAMHAEAITYTRQTLGYSAPPINAAPPCSNDFSRSVAATTEVVTTREERERDAQIPGGVFLLGSAHGTGFVFDNEQWAHAVTVAPFVIARTAVSNAEFAAFVNDGGYRRRAWWSDAGWQWRKREQARHPVYWKSFGKGQWLRRVFAQWLPLEQQLPVLHINWYEADAYCRWAGRRLPTEAEWEMAACCEPARDGLSARKRQYPWGDEAPTPERANLDWRALKEGGLLPVQALPEGDSTFGCRQMIGNVWEWTASDFRPYPGFARGPYKEYSAPWFSNSEVRHKVLRGGCWATRARLIRNNYRNFYQPQRRDVWAGFRTCAL